MEEMIPLTPEEMENASGGISATVRIKTAFVRSGPGLNYPAVATLSSGVTVNYMGSGMINQEDGTIWYMVNRPTQGWINAEDIGV